QQGRGGADEDPARAAGADDHRRRLGQVSPGGRMSAHFDVVIVGSGAGGGTLAQRLAPTGKSILILERGEHVPREAENSDPKTVFLQHKYRTKEEWYDHRGKPFVPNTHYWVGGNTTFYGAALMRLRKGDFDEVRHKGGVS